MALFTLAAPRADPFIGLVACWALLGIFNELGNPANLMKTQKFNFIDWPEFCTDAVRQSALVLSVASGGASVIAVARLAEKRKSLKVPQKEVREAEI